MDLDIATLRGLLERIAQGDEGALERLYDATLDRCYGLAVRIVRDPSSAEDVIAKTFVQVWQDAKKYKVHRGTPMAWLLTICRSRAIDQLRKSDRAETHPSPEILNTEFREHDDPVSLISALEESSQVRAALEGLAQEPRQVLALAFFRGYSHDEIAQHLQLPLGTVKSHIRRGQQRMREALTLMQASDLTGALVN
jgi:RNA polymerase sigma factor (sigma-70 family)